MEFNHTSKDLININIGLNNMAYRQDDLVKITKDTQDDKHEDDLKSFDRNKQYIVAKCYEDKEVYDLVDLDGNKIKNYQFIDVDLIPVYEPKELKITYDAPQFPNVKEYTPEYTSLFLVWCEDNNVYYYERPRDDFSKSEAIKLATNAGADILLLGDMS